MTVSRIGYYGKLPARADFVSRRLPEDFIKPWDAWIQSALAAGESWGGESWRRRFLASPTWRFALPAGTCGRAGWTGVLRPSTDAVGRCFPFVLAVRGTFAVILLMTVRITDGQVYSSFLWPVGGPHAPDGHVHVTVLAAPEDVPPKLRATRVIISWMRTVLPTPAPPNRPILPPAT